MPVAGLYSRPSSAFENGAMTYPSTTMAGSLAVTERRSLNGGPVAFAAAALVTGAAYLNEVVSWRHAAVFLVGFAWCTRATLPRWRELTPTHHALLAHHWAAANEPAGALSGNQRTPSSRPLTFDRDASCCRFAGGEAMAVSCGPSSLGLSS